VKSIVSGVPRSATTAIPNEPAWPPSPEPSSYAQTGVDGRSGWSCLLMGVWVNE
jgi:hypothetical protein